MGCVYTSPSSFATMMHSLGLSGPQSRSPDPAEMLPESHRSGAGLFLVTDNFSALDNQHRLPQ